MKTLKIMIIILSVGLLLTIAGCVTKEDEVVSVTGITLQGSGSLPSITTHAGTLQLSATITPADATDKRITWSVIDGTGSAIINQSGLLSAVLDGTVTVKVVSQSAKAISAELVITISNQVTDNTAPLADEIAAANQNMNETAVGVSADQFVPSVTWVLVADQTTYLQAITLAQTTLSETPLTDDEVLDAVSDLVSATNAFNLAKQIGTKIVLNINLGTAEAFVILSKTGISATGATSIIGDIGVSPVSASYITGFGLIMDSGNTFSISSLVTGHIYASDYQVGTPALLTSAIADVLTAYQDGAGRTADYTELYTGDLSGKTLTSGVYMWSNDVLINTDFTLNGSSTDVFIFQIAGTLTMAANTQITLTGGVLPENVYWVVADTIAVGVGADFQGIILSMTNVSMNTSSSITGMIYAQTSVSLDATVVTQP
ncbi:MAG: DUF3494 domain-containing protein [Ignavibacteriales bacterium]|jgi:hypothetical protein|nr:MAG: DUF3494 domain-containing protein [Ignavibacteriales bacterium]